MEIKRIISILLAAVLLAGLFPTAAFTVDTGGGNKAIELVAGGAAANIAGEQKSNVYFGAYQQSAKAGGGFNVDPVKWRVLSNAGGKLFLLADRNLDVVRYNESSGNVTWNDATLRKWLNGYDGHPYGDSFIGSAFSDKEAAAIAETELTNAPHPTFGTAGGENTTDKVFPLSIAEAENADYGLTNDDSRKAANTGYAAAGGHTGTGEMSATGVADWWWLRSPGLYSHYAAFVSYDGSVHDYGDQVDSDDRGVRPALKLDLNSVLFTSAAEGGKDGTTGTLSAVSDYDGSDWKLTLLDDGSEHAVGDGHKDFKAEIVYADRDKKWTISYSGARTGENEYISAIVTGVDGILYYGRLCKAQADPADPEAEPNTVTVDLSGIPIDENYSGGYNRLYIFNEQYNGDYLTDYASSLQLIKYPTRLRVSVNEAAIYTDEEMVITVALPGSATGSVTVTVNDVVYTVKTQDGRGCLTLSDLEPNEYKVRASYPGDEFYSGDSDTTSFSVHPYPMTDVVGLVVWDDDGKLSWRPEKINVRLLKDGVETSSKEVDEGEFSLWEFCFEDQLLFNHLWEKIAYSITVDAIENYTTAVEKAGDYGFRITNTLNALPADYSVTVVGGTADVATAKAGDTVTVTADMPAAGQGFVKWAEVEGVEFANAGSYTTTFVMPAGDVTLTAVLGKLTLPSIDDQTYTGDPIEFTFAPSDVKLEGLNRDLVQGTDYELSYEDNVEATGKPEVTLTLKAPLLGVTGAFFRIDPADISTAVVSISNNITRTPPTDVEVTVTFNGKTLSYGKDYTVTGDNLTGLEMGKYCININGMGNFQESKAVEFLVDKPLSYDVEITPGANMSKTADSGEVYQDYYLEDDAMESVVFTADEGYYFPENYAVEPVNGVTVTRDSFTRITVSGKPTSIVDITLAAPTAKAKEPTPAAVFTATGPDSGTLSNVAAGMKYRIGSGEWKTASGANVDLTDLAPCTVTVYTPGDGATTVDGDPQTITVTKAATPGLTAEQISNVGGKGGIPTTSAHEFRADGGSWTACSGETTDLAPGTYRVRVKASGTVLASDAQQIIIIAPGSVGFYGRVSLEGRSLTAGDVFRFEVFENGACVATGQSDASGEIGFTELNYFFGNVGTHTYTVRQCASDIAGVTIGELEYTVCVIVNYTPGDAALTVTPSEEFSDLNFTNTYDKQTPPDYTVPTGLKATYGQTLADVTLPDGWAWDDPLTTKVGNAGSNSFPATYTPADTTLYKTMREDLTVTVSKAEPEYTVPTGLTATYGQTLADLTLPDGWTWDDPLTTKVGSAGSNTFSATFVPTDRGNYGDVTVTLTVGVAKAGIPSADLPADEKPAAANGLIEDVFDQKLVTAPEKLPEGYTGVKYSSDGENWSDEIPVGREAGDYTVRIRYVGDGNHDDFDGDPISVTIAKAAYSFKLGEGEEPIHTKGSGRELTLTVEQTGAEDTSFEHLAGVFVGETELRKDLDYTATKGSTVVTILPAALDKLEVGAHTLTVRFTNGEASTRLEVLAPASPQTGDNGRIGLWIILAVVCATAVTRLLITGEKKRRIGR